MDQIAHVGVNVNRSIKLISLEIIFEVYHVKSYLNVTDGQTDRRTDDLLWHRDDRVVKLLELRQSE